MTISKDWQERIAGECQSGVWVIPQSGLGWKGSGWLGWRASHLRKPSLAALIGNQPWSASVERFSICVMTPSCLLRPPWGLEGCVFHPKTASVQYQRDLLHSWSDLESVIFKTCCGLKGERFTCLFSNSKASEELSEVHVPPLLIDEYPRTRASTGKF